MQKDATQHSVCPHNTQRLRDGSTRPSVIPVMDTHVKQNVATCPPYGQLLDGRKIAKKINDQVAATIDERLQAGRPVPRLVAIMVGEDAASKIYLRNKQRQCERTGIHSTLITLPASISQTQLVEEIQHYNADPLVHGILVQAPLPVGLDITALIEHISPGKDVDGFHPWNLGRLVQRRPTLRCCTPKGIMTLLAHTDIPIQGMHAVIIGASNHVGRPMSMELLLAGCTVTIAHKFTHRLEQEVARADIVIAAAGQPELIQGAWIKPGAIVVDVGINRRADGSIVGDVEFAEATRRAAWITPVPGGVGPMTVASLLENTLRAAQMSDTAAP